MGNGESTYDDSHDEYQQHPPSFVGSSMNTYNQPHYDPRNDFQHHPPHVGSSVDTVDRHKQHPTHIADNFNSLEQVYTVTWLVDGFVMLLTTNFFAGVSSLVSECFSFLWQTYKVPLYLLNSIEHHTIQIR